MMVPSEPCRTLRPLVGRAGPLLDAAFSVEAAGAGGGEPLHPPAGGAPELGCSPLILTALNGDSTS